MLFIKYNSGSTSTNETLYVHNLDDYKPIKEQIEYVEYITADGDEAIYIMEKFGLAAAVGGNWTMSIPWCFESYNLTQTWYGDIAKTILANL